MKRPYSTQDYAFLLKRIRERLPDAAIAADIMTVSGETPTTIRRPLDFIESCEFAAYMHSPFPAAREHPPPICRTRFPKA